MDRADRLALLLSLLAVLAGYLVSEYIFERIAHLEDEIAYLWQARAIAGGELTVPSPPGDRSFLVPFVVDHNGRRFGKYPLGWPAALALGERFDGHFLVNPLLAGLGVWLTYRLGKLVFGKTVGLLAAGLTLTSPFFLMNSGSLLSHPLGLVLSAAFALSWLGAFSDGGRRPGEQRDTQSGTSPKSPPGWLPIFAAAGSLGLLALTRPLTALAIAIPFGLHGVMILIRRDWTTRRRLLILGLIVLAMGMLHFVWQYAVTGDPLLNPYTLWWDYDRIGFGPGHGHLEQGHNLDQARINTRHSLRVGRMDLFGWLYYSWIFLPVGLVALLQRRKPWLRFRALLLASVFPVLLLVYLVYWIGSDLFGPRYYYEGLYSLTLVSAAGIALLAGWPLRPGRPFPDFSGWRRLRPLLVTFTLALLVSFNLIFYTPIRLSGMVGLYDMKRAYLQPFQTPEAQALAPALIIVHVQAKWTEYGNFIELEDPFLQTPFIFVVSRGPETNREVAEHFPERAVYHYYIREPYTFYKSPIKKP
jgi:hypothetical protein